MAGEFQQTIERINAKARIVAERYALILEQRDSALRRVAELEETLEKCQREIDGLKRQNEYLRMSTTLAPSRADVEHTRAVLSELVREIDKCIAELND